MNFAEVVLKEIDNKVKFHYHKGKSCFFINLKQSKVVIKDFNLDNISFIQKVNDFINFKLKPEILLKLLESKDISNSKVLIEHTSANPISNLHIGNLRVAYFGESLRRLNLYMGNKVVTQYYVNDLGNQAAISLMCYLKYPNIKLNELYSYYCKNTKEFSDSELKELIYKIEQNDKNLIKELSKIVKFNLDLIFKELQNLNIIIDQFIFESDINVQGQEFIKLLISEGIAKQKGNMVYYPINKNEIVLRKSNNCLTYISRDILYGLYKINQNYNIVYNIMGKDHQLYKDYYLEILEKILSYKPKNYNIELVNLVTTKYEKMSKRKLNYKSYSDFTDLEILSLKLEFLKNPDNIELNHIDTDFVKKYYNLLKIYTLKQYYGLQEFEYLKVLEYLTYFKLKLKSLSIYQIYNIFVKLISYCQNLSNQSKTELNKNFIKYNLTISRYLQDIGYILGL
jgi:hypothetical protein